MVPGKGPPARDHRPERLYVRAAARVAAGTGLAIRITKRIPVAAGLAGGSPEFTRIARYAGAARGGSGS
jgi:hypothetical protein